MAFRAILVVCYCRTPLSCYRILCGVGNLVSLPFFSSKNPTKLTQTYVHLLCFDGAALNSVLLTCMSMIDTYVTLSLGLRIGIELKLVRHVAGRN